MSLGESARRRTRPPGRYGIDAIYVPILLSVGFVAFATLSLLQASEGASPALLMLVAGVVIFAVGAGTYWHTTLRGKFAVWGDILDALRLRGEEHALDLGCGRGAVAVLTAQRLPRGSVTGIDLWRSRDQSGNSPAAAAANLAANGVTDRVRLDTGDMTRLPYGDASFDLVTASVSIHNIPTSEGRAAAIREAWRVLRPGGRLVIADIGKTDEYARVLAGLGAIVEGPRSLGWRMWWSPWMPTRLVRTVRT